MARRILNRKDLRAQAEAAERIKEEDEDQDEDEDEDDDDDDSGDDKEDADDDGDESDDEEEVPKKKKKPAAKAKTSKPRTRAVKTVRMQYVWGVFNNSHQRVAVYPYKEKQAAEEHALKLSTDKKSTFFVQPVKEPMEEKKE